MPRPSPPSVGAEAPRAAEPTAASAGGTVAVCCHAQYVPTLTAAAAWCVKAAVSKAAWWPWPLTFWPWKRCSSHVWRGLPLCSLWSGLFGLRRPLCSRLRPDVRDRETPHRQTERQRDRQTSHSIIVA